MNVDPGGRDYLVGAFHVARYVPYGFYCVPGRNRENSEPCLKPVELTEERARGRGKGRGRQRKMGMDVKGVKGRG